MQIGMVQEAMELAKVADNVVIKAVRRLSALGIATNMTLVFSATQALWAAKAGDGVALVADILQIYKNYGFKTEVIVASVRHVVEAAFIGAPIATVPYHVVQQLFDHPLTNEGIARFLKDWEGVPR